MAGVLTLYFKYLVSILLQAFFKCEFLATGWSTFFSNIETTTFFKIKVTGSNILARGYATLCVALVSNRFYLVMTFTGQ
jgi:hypothetical protein